MTINWTGALNDAPCSMVWTVSDRVEPEPENHVHACICRGAHVEHCCDCEMTLRVGVPCTESMP